MPCPARVGFRGALDPPRAASARLEVSTPFPPLSPPESCSQRRGLQRHLGLRKLPRRGLRPGLVPRRRHLRLSAGATEKAARRNFEVPLGLPGGGSQPTNE